MSVAPEGVCILRQRYRLSDALYLRPDAAVEDERLRHGRITSMPVELPDSKIAAAQRRGEYRAGARQRSALRKG